MARAAKKLNKRLAHLATQLVRDDEARAVELVERVARPRVTDAASSDSAALDSAPEVHGLLIINAKSGRTADSLAKLRSLVDTLASYGIGVEVRVKLRKSIARKEARTAAKRGGCRLVIAAGGDGTVAAVASGLVGTRATLGIIPLGTYNNTATSLGIPSDTREACALIAAGATRAIDVGEVMATGARKPRVFLESGGVGLVAALAPVGQHLEKGRWDAARESLPSALSMEPTTTRLYMDHSLVPQEARTLLVLIANGPRTGAGLVFAPTARMDDGLLDAQVYADLDQAALATRFVAAQGAAEALARSAMHTSARHIRVETDFPLPVVADSKVVGSTPATFRVRSDALRVIAGNGAGLSRPLSDRAMGTLREVAHIATPLPSMPASEDARPHETAIAVLSDVVPTAANVFEQARSARQSVLPIALAVLGGALLGPVLRRMARR